MTRPRTRPGFTLIEVIAALAIGTVLLAAVYGTLTFMLRSIQIGKEAVASMQIVRGTAIRVSTDIRQSLSLMMSTPSIAALAAPPPAGAGGDGGGGGAGETTPPDPGQFNFGMQGDAQTLTIYASSTPKYSQLDADSANSVFSDLRMIKYTLTTDGLVRQEIANVLSGTPDLTSEPEIIAPEVKELQFQYFDPAQATWVQQWDGTTNGPPAAVEVTVTVEMPNEPGIPPRPPVKHRFVVAIPSFGAPIPPQTQTGGAP